MAKNQKKRIDEIAELQPPKKRNWFFKMPEASQDELLTVRDNWKKGFPNLSGSALSEKILDYFPEVSVSSKEVARWLRAEQKK